MSNKPAGMLEDEVVEGITERLSLIPDIHLPFSLRSRGDSLTNSEKKSHLEDLLRRDAAIFLERHGRRLNPTELQEFDALKEDYEVNWHLKQLKSSINPTAEQKKAHAAVVKNRRLAFMDKLIQDSDFFSEDAMRMRAPLLYHQHLGRFQDPSERAFARPGERWSEMLIRQGEEVEYQARLKSEKEKAGLAESDDEEQEEEEEEEEEEDTEGEEEQQQGQLEQNVSGISGREAAVPNVEGGAAHLQTFEERQQSKLEEFSRYMHDKFVSGGSSENSRPSISSVELESRKDDFMRLMQEKFLSGEDTEHFDYVSIDHDTALDDYWLDEVSQDAQDKYFEED